MQHYSPLGNFKLKCDITTHLLEWLTFTIQTTPSVGENVEKQEHSLIAGENAKWYSDFGRHFCSFLES